MNRPLPPLNALRAFEAAARHLSMAKAAEELNVTPGALSHQIRGLEALLGVELFERGVRSIALTGAGARLYPGLRTAFLHMREAVDALGEADRDRVLVVSALPGFTAKWLAPRLYRFAEAHPEIDTRVSSSGALANFRTDGVHVALRNLPADFVTEPDLVIERLFEASYTPVCSPKLIERLGPFETPEALRKAPLIHDDSLATWTKTIGWPEWFARAGVDAVDASRGLRFSSADHALDATVEGAGVLLASDVLAYDELRTGRLVMPFDLKMPSGRVYCVVCPKRLQDRPNVRAFRDWAKAEAQGMKWDACKGAGTRALTDDIRQSRKPGRQKA
ncbi:MAG: transcriptional regulator GcvA [Rhodoblastus sp.]|nr:transcriptional regulator GcvA [Rhodoblastus sp.]